MILLFGRSGTGKTKYFQSLFSENRILHASSLEELRRSILYVNSPLIDTLPTLVNAWFDLDLSEIRDLSLIDVYVEAHYFEVGKNIQIRGSRNNRSYRGLKNENIFRRINFFDSGEFREKLREIDPPYALLFSTSRDNFKKSNLIEVFGTRYNMLKSQFGDMLE